MLDVRTDLDEIGALITDPSTYQRDEWEPLFARLRREDPVHYVKDSAFGPFWAITRFDDIKEIEANHAAFSSHWQSGGVVPFDVPEGHVMNLHSLMTLDPPEQAAHRNVVKSLGLSEGIACFEGLIRSNTKDIIAGLPRNEEFDWVEKVSIELTSCMLAAMMGYPTTERRDLVHWSDVVTCFVGDPEAPVASEEQRATELAAFYRQMIASLQDCAELPPATNLLSLLAHSDLMNALPRKDRMDTLVTFLVGGNDTTRNTMSAGLWALWQHPAEHWRVRNDPALIPSFVQETLRWHTPSLNMRRNATTDVSLRGKKISKGDKVVLWYISGNRDEQAFDRAAEFLVDRDRPGRHLTFGHGVHRCLGSKIAELQLRVLWEEFFASGLRFEILGQAQYAYSSVLRAIRHLPVRIHG